MTKPNINQRIFFTSDTHFGHGKEFVCARRGFNTVDEMDRELIKRWNETVGKDDIVYHLGDMFMKGFDTDLLGTLHGHIHLIRGNHDTDNKLELMLKKEYVESVEWAGMLHYQHKHFYLCHFPAHTTRFAEDDFDLRGRTLNLYGHTHQDTNFFDDNPFMYHVGVDSHDLRPVSIDDIIEEIRVKRDEELAKLRNKVPIRAGVYIG